MSSTVGSPPETSAWVIDWVVLVGLIGGRGGSGGGDGSGGGGGSGGILGLLHMAVLDSFLEVALEKLDNLPHTTVVPDFPISPRQFRALLRDQLIQQSDKFICHRENLLWLLVHVHKGIVT
jgi:hypothetical protein